MRLFLPSLTLALTAAFLLTASARAQTEEAEVYDPFEGYNRVIFKFNDAVDQNILVPITKGYRTVVPGPVRDGVHNVLVNLKSPLTIGNQVLQGDMRGAGNATIRTITNTTIGIGGLLDAATFFGIPKEEEDFGQTLAMWGVPDGPYLVVPFLAPANMRDHAGNLTDMLADPMNNWLMNTGREATYYIRMGVSALDTRTQLFEALADLRTNAIDYYATLRSATAQRRAALIADQSPDSAADIPNYGAGEQ